MSFGVVQSAVSSVKYCRSLLSKRDKLKNTLHVNKKEAKFELKNPQLSQHQLKRLKEKLQREHKNIRTKQYIVLVLIMFVLVSIFIYYL